MEDISIYGMGEKKKTSTNEYFGFSLKGTEEYYDAVTKDLEVIRKKFGLSSKRMTLFAAIKLAAKSIRGK